MFSCTFIPAVICLTFLKESPLKLQQFTDKSMFFLFNLTIVLFAFSFFYTDFRVVYLLFLVVMR